MTAPTRISKLIYRCKRGFLLVKLQSGCTPIPSAWSEAGEGAGAQPEAAPAAQNSCCSKERRETGGAGREVAGCCRESPACSPRWGLCTFLQLNAEHLEHLTQTLRCPCSVPCAGDPRLALAPAFPPGCRHFSSRWFWRCKWMLLYVCRYKKPAERPN